MNKINNHLNTNHEHRTITNTLIAGFDYAFDKENNKLYENRLHEDPVKGDAYLYDAIYRLTGVKYGVPNLQPSITYTGYTTYDSKEEFSLDGVGNRIEVTNGITTTYTTNNLNQYTQISATALTYDLNGNLKDDGTNTYIYDYANRLLRVTRKSDGQILGEYKYDSLGRRIQRTYFDNSSLITHNYYYDGVRCIEEHNAVDVVIAQYTYGNQIDEVLRSDYPTSSIQHPISGVFYYHENSLGSIYAVTNDSGNVVERYKYDVYGKVSFFDGSGNPITQSLISNRYLFTGREYDPETGLYYYRARYYSAEMGRFINRDPAEDDNFLNLYAYVNNNPINFNDPFGLKAKEPSTSDGWLKRIKKTLCKIKWLKKIKEILEPPPPPALTVPPKKCENRDKELGDILKAYEDTVITLAKVHELTGKTGTRVNLGLMLKGNPKGPGSCQWWSDKIDSMLAGLNLKCWLFKEVKGFMPILLTPHHVAKAIYPLCSTLEKDGKVLDPWYKQEPADYDYKDWPPLGFKK